MAERRRLCHRLTRPATVVGVLSLCGIVVSLQQSLLLPLIPALPQMLDISTDHASWLVTATLLSGAVSTPIIGRLADMHGKRLMMLIALASTVAGSTLGAFADGLPALVVARVLQGVGIALVPVAIATMRDVLPPRKIPLGVALISTTLAVGAGIGPPLSGFVAEHLNWHAIFILTGAIGLVLLPLVWLIPESTVRSEGTFDFPGAVLLSTGLTALLVALTSGTAWGWGSAATASALGLSAVALAGWVVVEMRTAHPLVDLRVAGRGPVLLTNAASLLVGFAMFANLLLTIQVMQTPPASGFGLGLDVASTGTWMVPNAIVFATTAPVAAWLVRRHGPGVTLMTGSALMAIAYVVRIPLSDSLAQVITACTVTGAGTALTFSAMPALITMAVPVTETGSANGFNTLLRSVGTSSASAVTAAVGTASAVAVGSSMIPDRGAFVTVCAIAAVCSLLGAVLCLPLLRVRPGQVPGAAPTSDGHGFPARHPAGALAEPSAQ